MTPPNFAESVVTPNPGIFPIPGVTMSGLPVLGQLSVVSATQTAPTVPPNLRTVPQAMDNVMSNVIGSNVVVPGAAVSTATCTAPSYLVPVIPTQLPVKPQAGTITTPVATFPNQTSVLDSVPPVAPTVNVPPVVTTVSVPPVLTTVQAPPVVTSVSAPPVATTLHATTPTVITSIAPVVNITAAPAAPIIVVKQSHITKPYTSQTSWKSYKEYFTRLALCNGWTTGVEKAQNLLIAMEGASAETVKGLTADKDKDYDLICENLSHRFGHIDEPEQAKRRFDAKKQLKSDMTEVFEQGLRTIFCEAWPTGDPKSKESDSMLQRRFIDGLIDPALQQFLHLHARTDDVVTTVAKARQYMDAQEQAKVSAISKKPNVRFAAAVEDPQSDRIQPIIDGLQKVLQTVLDNQSHPPVVTVGEQAPGNGGPKKGKGKGNRAPSPAPSDASTSMVNQDTRYQEPEPRGHPSKALPALSWNNVPMPA